VDVPDDQEGKRHSWRRKASLAPLRRRTVRV
jgi:hypothetical protein